MKIIGFRRIGDIVTCWADITLANKILDWQIQCVMKFGAGYLRIETMTDNDKQVGL